jgi:hypothetical protein
MRSISFAASIESSDSKNNLPFFGLTISCDDVGLASGSNSPGRIFHARRYVLKAYCISSLILKASHAQKSTFSLATLPPCRKTQCCFFLALEPEQGSDSLDDDLYDPEECSDHNDHQNQWQAGNESNHKRCVF